MNLVGLKRQFLVYLELDKGRSAKTIENYDRYLTRFLVYAEVKQSGELTDKLVGGFRLYLSGQLGAKVGGKQEAMKVQTQNYHLIALRAFLKYLELCKVVTLPPKSIKLAKAPDRSLRLASRLELKRLLTTPSGKTLAGKRDRAILELLFSSGLRNSQLCDLRVADVDLARDELTVWNKDGKARIITLTDSVARTLNTYLRARTDREKALFIRYGKKAQIGAEAKISPKTVQRLLKHYAGEAGIIGSVTPQIIRHSFAKNLLNHGADLYSLQLELGHANISTTQFYVKATEVDSGANKNKPTSVRRAK